MTFVFSRSLLAAGLAVATLAATPALASAALSAGPGRTGPSVSSLSTVITDTVFDVTGIFSNDPFGAAINERYTITLAPGASVIGIGWDVTLFADSPSWLSEMVVAFGSTSTSVVNLTPGVGDDFPGTESYSSGGVVDLVGIGFDFTVDADGKLQLEFFDSFDDFPNDWDGIWQSGALTIRWSTDNGAVIPEPGTWAMMIAGFGLVGFAARRRRDIVTA